MARPHAGTRSLIGSQLPAASPFVADVVGNRAAARVGRLNRFNFLEKIGAGEEIRTLDPNLGKVPRAISGASRIHPEALHISDTSTYFISRHTNSIPEHPAS